MTRALLLAGVLGCASPVIVAQSPGGCTVTADLGTGESISCGADGVRIERASISQTTGRLDGLLGGVLRTMLGAGVVP